MTREDNIYQEAAALWQAIYSEPPPDQADGRTLLEMIVAGGGVPDYGRLRSPHLRAANIAGPGQPKA